MAPRPRDSKEHTCGRRTLSPEGSWLQMWQLMAPREVGPGMGGGAWAYLALNCSCEPGNR